MKRHFLSKFTINHIWIISVCATTTLLIVSQFTFFLSSALATTSTVDFNGNIGVATGAVSSYSSVALNKEFKGIAKAGFKSVRFDFSWSIIQPQPKNDYDWSIYDNIVKIASANHLRILGILDDPPAWADNSGCQNNCGTVMDVQFASFVAAAASRYKNSVSEWEIWNEENIKDSWAPVPSAEQYAQLLKSAYPAIKNVNTNAVVVLGGMAVSDTRSGNVDPVVFLDEIYKDGAGRDFDAVGYHPYTFPGTAFTPNNSWAKMDATTPSLRSVMIANGDSAKQIWITEYGAPTNGPDPSQYVSQTSQAQEVLYAYIALQNKSWAGPLYWYTYQDSSTNTSTNQNFFGLVNANGKKKTSYHIWEQLLKP